MQMQRLFSLQIKKEYRMQLKFINFLNENIATRIGAKNVHFVIKAAKLV